MYNFNIKLWCVYVKVDWCLENCCYLYSCWPSQAFYTTSVQLSSSRYFQWWFEQPYQHFNLFFQAGFPYCSKEIAMLLVLMNYHCKSFFFFFYFWLYKILFGFHKTMLNFKSYLIMLVSKYTIVRFDLFNGITTLNGLFNAKIWFIIMKVEREWFGLVWFGLFNGISTLYGLSNVEIWFICKYLIVIITIFLMFQC